MVDGVSRSPAGARREDAGRHACGSDHRSYCARDGQHSSAPPGARRHEYELGERIPEAKLLVAA
jgi:hypothetical protein